MTPIPLDPYPIHTAVALTPGEIIPAAAILLGDSFPEFTLAETRTSSLSSDGKGDNHHALKTADRRHILRVLEQMGGNKRKAAKALGISRSTLDRKLGV